MNIRQYITALTGLCGLLLASCDDGIMDPVGNTILPDEDKVTVYADTFQIIASTVEYDSLYARTNSGYLGEFYDPLYGRLKSDYLCQFYCKEGFRFYQTPDNGRIDSVSLVIMYDQWKGDPNIPMQISAYPVVRELTKNFYTNIDPTVFCDMRTPATSQAYSAQSGTIIDSLTTTGTYLREHKLPLSVEWGQKLYDETINNPSSFNDQESFNRYFPGLYITTDYGSGNMLYVYYTQIRINYHTTLQSSAGEDSIVNITEVFNVSKDVIQLNRFQSTDTEKLLENNNNYSYIKTPAGIFTHLVIPSVEIDKILKNRIVNYVSLNLKYMPQEDLPYALTPPPYLLLLPEDSIGTFFENRNIENNITSYVSNYSGSSSVGYNEAGRVYPFPNISNLLSYHISLKPDEDLRLLVVPVNRTVGTSGSNTYTTALSHYLAPSGLEIRKDGDNMKGVIISSYLYGK
ncbi:MAG: DUF4270 domain-containing protein [Tannerella sp.]|jgi:hypothetical protein|nr:DUF4270 domain-containing protein [Tannerella sp.]